MVEIRVQSFRVAAAGLLISLIAGCGGSPAVNFYTLTPTAETTTSVGKKLAVAVGPVEFPRELQRNQIVTRTSSHRVKVDEFERWAGSLELDFTRTVADNLSILLGSERIVAYPAQPRFAIDYRVGIDVRQFDGSIGQAVTLRARWSIINGTDQQVMAVENFEISQPVADASYESLVAAHSAAIGKLSRVIADRLAAAQ